MRILHVYEASSVGAVLTKYQNLAGCKSYIIHPEVDKNDPYDVMGFYGYKKHSLRSISGRLRFMARLSVMARRADILHMHGWYNLLERKYMRRLGTKVILHHHGSFLRNNPKLAKAQAQMADAVIVGTPDLTEYMDGVYYVPTPIDTDHFRPQKRRGSGYVWRKYPLEGGGGCRIQMQKVWNRCQRNSGIRIRTILADAIHPIKV